MKRIPLGALLASLASLACAQSSTAPRNDAVQATSKSRQPLSPEESFGTIYGTKNLMHAPATPPAEFLKEQNQRDQPPASPEPFAAHVRNNSLVEYVITAMQADPRLDPTSAIIASWNLVSLDMTSIDHTTEGDTTIFSGAPNNAPVPVFEATYGEQFGPPRSSRALAIVHLAMAEAANVIDHRYISWMPQGATSDIRSGVITKVGGESIVSQASMAAAVTEAAYRALTSLYPRKHDLLNAARVELGVLVNAQAPSLALAGGLTPEKRIELGKQIGDAAADTVLLARSLDGSEIPASTSKCLSTNSLQPDNTITPDRLCREAYFIKGQVQPVPPFDWTLDPISLGALKLGENWGSVAPWVLSPHEFVTDAGLILGGAVKPTPTPTSSDFLQSLNSPVYGTSIVDPHGSEKWSTKYGVKFFGGFNINLLQANRPLSPGAAPREPTATSRQPDQQKFARFWGYDGTALLCAPPRLYNMVATSFWHQNMSTSASGAHAPVAFARYLALVNVSLAEAGISAWDAKYRYHVARPVTYIQNLALNGGDPKLATWTPLGQVGSNGAPDGVTPGFPSYPSGHAVFGGALFEIIAKLYDRPKDDPLTKFSFVSDEFNGRTFGADGQPREYIEAHYPSLGFAEWENAESRIWLGIHWQMDADDGSQLGEQIADAVYNKLLKPLPTN